MACDIMIKILEVIRKEEMLITYLKPSQYHPRIDTHRGQIKQSHRKVGYPWGDTMFVRTRDIIRKKRIIKHLQDKVDKLSINISLYQKEIWDLEEEIYSLENELKVMLEEYNEFNNLFK